jgi:hypothetical protein
VNFLGVASDDRTWRAVLAWIQEEQATLAAVALAEGTTGEQRAAAAAEWRALERLRLAPTETAEAMRNQVALESIPRTY